MTGNVKEVLCISHTAQAASVISVVTF